MTIFHDPDDAWQYASVTDVPHSRWLFGGGAGIPTPHVWNGAAWVRWYGPNRKPYAFSPETLQLHHDLIGDEYNYG